MTDRIFQGIGRGRATTIRVNTLKWSAASLMGFLKENGIGHRRVTWYPDAFVLPEAREKDVEGWAAYAEGRVYMQSLSSMIPALVLAPRPGESVLDIAAAPGSKTTQMAAMMGNSGRILAVEANAIRAERLSYNLRLQGASIAEVRVGRGESLGEEHDACFDRVLVDAPCSGEGRFTSFHPTSWRSWSLRTVSECTKIQRKLLAAGARALKPGGILVYSTCTLNLEENERMALWAIDNLPLTAETARLSIPCALGAAPGTDTRLPAGAAVRILPDAEMEGFFLARFRKKG